MAESKSKASDQNGGVEVVTLRKTIGVPQGAAIIVGVIVGSGIFVSPVGVLRQTHSVGMAMIMWLVCGVFSLLGAICYAELGVTIPRSGGEYIYILKSFGALPAFMGLWIMYVTIGCVSTAANSLLFAEYLLKAFYLDCDVPFVAMRLVAFLGVGELLSLMYSMRTAGFFKSLCASCIRACSVQLCWIMSREMFTLDRKSGNVRLMCNVCLLC